MINRFFSVRAFCITGFLGLIISLALAGHCFAAVIITGNLQQVTYDPADQFDPAISGDLVVYADARNGNLDVYYTNLLTGVEETVATTTGTEDLQAVSGNIIVYSTRNIGFSETFAFSVDTKTIRNITSPGIRSQDPAIAGDLVAFQQVSPQGEKYIQGFNLKQGTSFAVSGAISGVSQSPSVGGSHIVYRVIAPSGFDGIGGFDTATGRHYVVADSAQLIFSVMSPDTDGVTIVYSRLEDVPVLEGTPGLNSLINREWNVFVYDIASGATRRIGLPGDQTRPRVDGDIVVFDDDNGGDHDVVIYHIPTGTMHRIPGAGTWEFLNDISGNRVAFTSNASGNLDIWVYEFTVANDADADGVSDASDNCPATANPDQADGDGDGQGDVCDPCPLDPRNLDSDFDGFCNAWDNCPFVANPGQRDTNGNGVGDVCEPCNVDSDRDGLCDALDNCPLDPNTDQADVDGDGAGDACDPIDDRAPLVKAVGGAVVRVTQNPDGSWTYVIQGTGSLGGTYEFVLPAGASGIGGEPVWVVLEDAAGGSAQPLFGVSGASLPPGSTKSITIPRPGGIQDRILCVRDIEPVVDVFLNGSCIPQPGMGPVKLDGWSGSYSFTLDDAVIRQVTYTKSTVTVSGLLHSALYLGVNSTPVADAGTGQAVIEGAAVSLDGSGSSDTDGDALSYAWAMDVVPAGSLLGTWTSAGVTALFTPDKPGQYIVTLVVNDGLVDSAADTVAISVSANLPPTASATGTPTTSLAPLTVNFDAAASSDPEGLPIASYSWNFGDGSATSTLVNPGHEYTIPGNYTAVVTVTDAFGNTAQAQVGIIVTAPNLPPTVAPTAIPVSGVAPLETKFVSNAVDPEGNTLTYAWDFGDGSSSAEATPIHTYIAAGTYIATVTASDGTNTTSASLTISVGSPLTASVTEAKVDFGEHGKVKGKITMKASFTYDSTPVAADVIKVVFDGITLMEALYGSFKADKDDPGEYKYKGKNVHAKIDFTKNEIKVNRHKMLLNGIDNSNGVDVVIHFGDAVATDHFDMAEDEDADDADRDHKKEMHHKKHHD